MASKQPFEDVVDQIEDLVQAATNSDSLSDSGLRDILGFLTKVAQVIEQAFSDVLTVLIELKHTTPQNWNIDRPHLSAQLDQLLVRSRYRDAEEICSRLHHLSDQFRVEIEPLVAGLGDKQRWWQVFGLIDEHEGKVIELVRRTVQDLSKLLLDAGLREVQETAADRAEKVAAALAELRKLTSGILGLSGRAGFLELTGNRPQLKERVSSVIINKGTIKVSKDTYNVGQAAAVGPGARAKNITLNHFQR